MGVLAHGEGGTGPVAGDLLDQPVDAGAQGRGGGVGGADVRHRRQCLRHQCRTGRVELDVAAEDDVVDGEVRAVDAQGVVAGPGQELARGFVAGAALGAQPGAAGQDGHVARLHRERGGESVGRQQAAAADHHRQLERAGDGRLRDPAPAHRERAGELSTDLEDVEDLGQVIDGHV